MGGLWGETKVGEVVIGTLEFFEEGWELSKEDGDFSGGVELVFELGDG